MGSRLTVSDKTRGQVGPVSQVIRWLWCVGPVHRSSRPIKASEAGSVGCVWSLIPHRICVITYQTYQTYQTYPDLPDPPDQPDHLSTTSFRNDLPAATNRGCQHCPASRTGCSSPRDP